MALLQISEPGQTAAPHQHKLAVGIDLGTTNSLVATVRSGQTQVLLDEQERALVPSVVHYAEQKKQLGLKPLPKLHLTRKIPSFQLNVSLGVLWQMFSNVIKIYLINLSRAKTVYL
ncbi:Chaperone protein HscA [Mannheimia haemolytica]